MLGWPAGIVCLIIFAWITLYSSQLLADCHIVEGKRTRSYIEQVGTTRFSPARPLSVQWAGFHAWAASARAPRRLPGAPLAFYCAA